MHSSFLLPGTSRVHLLADVITLTHPENPAMSPHRLAWLGLVPVALAQLALTAVVVVAG